MRDGMRKSVKTLSPAEEVIWWMVGDNHHQSITIYSSEDAAKKHRLELEKFRKTSSTEYSTKMEEETMGAIIDQMSHNVRFIQLALFRTLEVGCGLVY